MQSFSTMAWNLTGIFEIIAGIQLPMSKDWLLVLAGVLSVVFGGLVAFYPESGAVAIVAIIGIYALVFGVTFIVFSLRLKGLGDKLAPQTTSA